MMMNVTSTLSTCGLCDYAISHLFFSHDIYHIIRHRGQHLFLVLSKYYRLAIIPDLGVHPGWHVSIKQQL